MTDSLPVKRKGESLPCLADPPCELVTAWKSSLPVLLAEEANEGYLVRTDMKGTQAPLCRGES